jgi:hypothetical protein
VDVAGVVAAGLGDAVRAGEAVGLEVADDVGLPVGALGLVRVRRGDWPLG